MKRLCLAVVSILVLACTPELLLAQGGRSTILGTVTDESGAAVTGVTVTVVNTGTQQKRVSQSNERGDYEVPALDVGAYEVAVEATGFRRAVVRSIQLEIDQRARVDVKLQVGEITQQISVEANVSAVQTDDSTLSTVIDAAKSASCPFPETATCSGWPCSPPG